ncbi:decapping and exoribonuclease protein isoform X1 [Heteronotia binoei]|uniref:decapping and exoribonuclease protein isoform X1 n=2 Tax=Heteronotia binoei TaxID=13085 RepID=UPI00292EE096|nr:decapping and exoribonuclease protein isoform X1 [Heteronotia binoei]
MTSAQSPMKPSDCSGKRDRGDDEDTLEDKTVKSQRSNAKPPLTLPVTPSRYDAPFPFYRRPAEVGRFSLDSQRRYHGDTRQMRYYAPPPTEGPSPGFDLRDGYHDRYVQRDESIREGLDHLLQWVSQNRKQLQGAEEKGQLLNTDFVTWRGHLTKVLTTPYEKQDGWLLAVSLFRGTLYISEFETDSARRQREQRSEMLKELTYMGYKFEHYMCADTPDGIPDPTAVVNTNEGFCTVIRTRLGTHSLVFSGEVDCTDPRSPWPDPPSCYVELKTSKVMHSPAQRKSFYRHKMIKWWAQSFLPGVSRIVAGYRGPDGSVVGLETFETMKIFQLIREDPGCWKPAVCMNFCAAFLSFVKKVVTEDNPKLVHLFAWEPGHPVSFTVHRDSEYTFLPDWYVEALSMEKPPTPQIPD